MTEHIKIPDVAPLLRVLADGTQTIFEYRFPVFTAADLIVSFNGIIQTTGFDITGAGETEGGTVIFDMAPANGTVITLERRLVFERLSDFLEGGDFSARSLNNELDYMVAGLQQVSRDQSAMLHYAEGENPASTALPTRTERANKALGFDGDGNPVAVSLAGSMAAPNFTAIGTGGVTRTSHDKFMESVSVKDFGAIGDGLTNDTGAIIAALSAHDHIKFPAGTYLVTAPIIIGAGKYLQGCGEKTVLQTVSAINLIEFTAENAKLSDMKLVGGTVGVNMTATAAVNRITDIHIHQAQTGIKIDGAAENYFSRITVTQPAANGIHLTKTGSTAPRGNNLHQCRVVSQGATISGHGIYVEHGEGINAVVDCAIDMAAGAQASIRAGAGATRTMFVNTHTRAAGSVPHLRLDAGSADTSLINFIAEGGGVTLIDYSGGAYYAFNTSVSVPNRFGKTSVSDLSVGLNRYETRAISGSGTIDIVADKSVQMLSSSAGAITARLPNATTVAGAAITIKKTDSSGNIVTIAENGGAGPNGQSWPLAKTNDYVTVISDGAIWQVVSSNRSPGSARYYDGYGTYDIDMAVDVYLLSTLTGAMTARLPLASSGAAIGRQITIKKVDATANAITISENGGPGPDNFGPILSARYEAITLISDGSNWHIVSRFP